MTLQIKSTRPPTRRLPRVLASMWRQRSKTITCPPTPELNGMSVLVTGGQSGVGEFISRGLLDRGARITTLSRGVSINSGRALDAKALIGDLGEPASVMAALDIVQKDMFDIVICNAGAMFDRYSQNSLGVEKTCAVNVLGHHILYQTLLGRGQLSPQARIIMTTGDIYAIANDCTPNFHFRMGPMAYARSKLGNMWQMRELNDRYPHLNAMAVHPGVVASGFAGSKSGLMGDLKNRLFVSEEQGAQTALIAATQEIPRGTYLHNVFGTVDLQQNDIALDTAKSTLLWNALETLSKPFLDA